MRVNSVSYLKFTSREKVEDNCKCNEPIHFAIMLKFSKSTKYKAEEQYRILKSAMNENRQQRAFEIIKDFEKLPKDVQSCIPIIQNYNNENIFISAVKNNQPEVALKFLKFVKTLPQKAQIDFAFIRDRYHKNQWYVAHEHSQKVVRDAFDNFIKTLPKDIQIMTYQYYGPRQYYNDNTVYGDDLDWG